MHIGQGVPQLWSEIQTNRQTKRNYNLLYIDISLLSLCHKFDYLIPLCLQHDVIDFSNFQTINSVRSNDLSLKYQRLKSSDCNDIGTRKFELFAAKTYFSRKSF